jgi:CBS domain-containing protein
MFTSITVAQVLRTKDKGFIAIGTDASAFDALEIMEGKNLGALLVVENGELIGVFSERDYARKVILKGKSSKNTQVREIMSESPIFVNLATSLRDCMVLMTDKHIRHLPVINNGVILGVVSMRDVVNAIVTEQEATIEELEEYIAGTGYRA